MAHFMDRVRVWQQLVVQATHSDFARQMRTVLTTDLPILLAEMTAIDPAEQRDLRAVLDAGLTNLIGVCTEEQKSLGGWHAARALTLKLSLDRLSGAAAPLESTVARYALALRRTDQRLAAIGLPFYVVNAAPSPHSSSTTSATVSGPLVSLSGSEYRRMVSRIRRTLRDIVVAAQRVQSVLRSAHARDAEMMAGVVEQMRTLLAWVRQEQERHAALLCRASVG